MTESSIVGTRIRERRIQAGVKQAELAKRAGISPSYLNLIEHNRRRIGGKVLLQLAGALGVEPTVLIQGAAATLIAGLREAVVAAQADEASVELDKLEEFAERFPGWAELITMSSARINALERSVSGLTDRLAHDPHLAESLHEVISVAAAIRSTASILVDTPKLEQQWQRRFHRNINEDGRRLADGAKALVRYLDVSPESDVVHESPQEELDAFLIGHGFHFPNLEDGSAQEMEAVLAKSIDLESEAAQSLARGFLTQYMRDAANVPYDQLTEAVEKHGLHPVAVAAELGTTVALVTRRIASLPEALIGEVGLAVCDSSGALLLRRPVTGFSVPRGAAGCALWTLYHALARPGAPIRQAVRQVGRESRDFMAFAIAEPIAPQGYQLPVPNRAYMLLVPQEDASLNGTLAISEMGVTCRICALQGCPARREPSILRPDL